MIEGKMNARDLLKRNWGFVLPLAAVAVLSVIVPNGCRDPNDFKPPPDTAQTPPPPPYLIAPKDSAIYNIYGTGVTVYFHWSKVDSAEIYEINYTDTLGNDISVLADSSPKYRILPRGLYNWRVRAGNGAWTDGYTDWSETREFHVMNFSTDILISPPDAAVFITDTFPYNLPLIWHSIGDRILYTLEIYLDALPLNEIFLWDTVYNFSVPDSGFYPWYEWQIRAFNPQWVNPCSIITVPNSFIVIRPGDIFLRSPLDKKWNSVIIRGKR
jgi:hypothetical protein